MHVLGVTDHLGNVGGAEISTRTILAGLADRESVDKVTVVGIDSQTEDRLDFGDAEVVGVELPGPTEHLPEFAGDLIVERLLSRAIRRRLDEADVVHAHHRRSALAVSRLETRTPTVATVRDFWPTCPISIYHVNGEPCTGCEDRLGDCVRANGWDGIVEPGVRAYLLSKRRHQRPTLEALDAAVFIADHLRERLRGVVPLPERTEVLYNPVSVPADIEPVRSSRPTFVTASSLTESKGVETAVRAMSDVVRSCPEARLIVFGDGPERDRLEALPDEAVLDAVEFRGRVPVEQVYRTIAGATATVFPSIWEEPFGRITVESMMLGTPVVGSDVGGIGEIVADGETGVLFPPGDAGALATALITLIEDDQLRNRLATDARTYAERFSPEQIVDEHLALYRSLD